MSSLWLITGPAGVGKSTISRKLAESFEKSVLLEGDEIYHQVIGGYCPAWKEKNHLEVFEKVVIATIQIYLENGYEVVFNYVLSASQIKTIQNAIQGFGVFPVVLLTTEEELLKRDAKRPEDCQMKERCKVLLKSFQKQDFRKEDKLDTTNLSIEETLQEILKRRKEF